MSDSCIQKQRQLYTMRECKIAVNRSTGQTVINN